MLAYLLHTNPDWIEALIRITPGVVFSAHGAQKVIALVTLAAVIIARGSGALSLNRLLYTSMI